MQANLTFAGYHTQLLWVDVPVEVHHDAGLDCTSQTARLQHNCSACRLPCCGKPGSCQVTRAARVLFGSFPTFRLLQLKRHSPGGARKTLSLTKRRSCKPASRIAQFVPFHVVLCFSIVVLLMHRPCLLSRRSFVLQSTWLKGCKIGYPAQISLVEARPVTREPEVLRIQTDTSCDGHKRTSFLMSFAFRKQRQPMICLILSHPQDLYLYPAPRPCPYWYEKAMNARGLGLHEEPSNSSSW